MEDKTGKGKRPRSPTDEGEGDVKRPKADNQLQSEPHPSNPPIASSSSTSESSSSANNSTFSWDSLLVDVLKADRVTKDYFKNLTLESEVNLSDWATVTSEKKGQTLRTSLNDIFKRERYSSDEERNDLLGSCISALDLAVKTLKNKESHFFLTVLHHDTDLIRTWKPTDTNTNMEYTLRSHFPYTLGDKSEKPNSVKEFLIIEGIKYLNELANSAAERARIATESRKVIQQSGIQFAEVLKERANDFRGEMPKFQEAAVGWIKNNSSNDEATSIVINFYEICNGAWRSFDAGNKDPPDLNALMDDVVSKVLSVQNMKSLEDFRTEHINGAKESDILLSFFKHHQDSPQDGSHIGGHLPVNSTYNKLELEYMSTYVNLQFTATDLAKEKCVDMIKQCTDDVEEGVTNLVLGASATGKTGTAIRTLTKRGGLYMDFHIPNERSQFSNNLSFHKLRNDVEKKLPYLREYIALWILAQFLHLALIVRKHGDNVTLPDLLRAQLNGNRKTVEEIYTTLTGMELYKFEFSALSDLVKAAHKLVSKGNPNMFDVVILDEAQTIKDQRYVSGPFFSPKGNERGLLSVIQQVLLDISCLKNIFVMGTAYSIDMTGVVQSVLLKDPKHRIQVLCLLPCDFIRGEQQLVNMLRKLLNVEDCIEDVIMDDDIRKMLPLRARVVSRAIQILGEILGSRQSRSPLSSKVKAEMLKEVIKKSYDSVCKQVFISVVKGTSTTRPNATFELSDLNKEYGQDVDNLFIMNESNASDDSLYRIMKSSILDMKNKTVTCTLQDITGPAGKVGAVKKDWLSLGLAGAENITLNDFGIPTEVTYRTDEPLTFRVCEMLLQIAHHRNYSRQEGDLDWPSMFAYRVLKTRSISDTNDDREFAVGNMFCRPLFQGKVLSELPFITGASVSMDSIDAAESQSQEEEENQSSTSNARNSVSGDITSKQQGRGRRGGKGKTGKGRTGRGRTRKGKGRQEEEKKKTDNAKWMSKVIFQCHRYLPIEKLLPAAPLRNMVIVFDGGVSEKEELGERVKSLGAKVMSRLVKSVTHFVFQEPSGTDASGDNNKWKRLRDAHEKIVTCVTPEWVRSCLDMEYVVSERDFLVHDDYIRAAYTSSTGMEVEEQRNNAAAAADAADKEVVEKAEILTGQQQVERLLHLLRTNPESVTNICIKMSNTIHPDYLIILPIGGGTNQFAAITVSLKIYEDKVDKQMQMKSFRSTDLRLACLNNYVNVETRVLTDEKSQWPTALHAVFQHTVRLLVHISTKEGSSNESSHYNCTELRENDVLRVLDTEKSVRTLIVDRVRDELHTSFKK